jgi:hypothetical protein
MCMSVWQCARLTPAQTHERGSHSPNELQLIQFPRDPPPKRATSLHVPTGCRRNH